MARLLMTALLLLTAGCASVYAPRDPVAFGPLPSLERSSGDDLFARPVSGGVDLAPLVFESRSAQPTADPELLEALRAGPESAPAERHEVTAERRPLASSPEAAEVCVVARPVHRP